MQTIKKDKAKEGVKGKGKRSAKKAMGVMQEPNQAEIRKHLLYLLQDGAIWGQLADGTYVAKGECGCVLKIRSQDFETTMLSLQHKSWGTWSCLLRPHAKGNRPRSNGSTPKRQTSKRKGATTLPKPNRPIWIKARTNGKIRKIKFYTI